MTLWADAGRLAMLLILWASLVPARGAACARSWWLGVEGLGVVAAAWFAADGIAAQLSERRKDLAPWEHGRSLARVSFAVAVALVLAWGLAAIALCRRAACVEPDNSR